MWNIYTRDYYTVKRTKVQIDPTTSMNLTSIKGRKQDTKGYVLHDLGEISRTDKPINTAAVRNWEEGDEM